MIYHISENDLAYLASTFYSCIPQYYTIYKTVIYISYLFLIRYINYCSLHYHY